jgi:anti-anti-sigma factor
MGFAISDLDGETQLVEASGELDLATAPDLGARLSSALDHGRIFIVVDLTQVSFLDSTALNVLVAAHRRAEMAGGAITLTGIAPNIHRILKITGLDSVLNTAGRAMRRSHRQPHAFVPVRAPDPAPSRQKQSRGRRSGVLSQGTSRTPGIARLTALALAGDCEQPRLVPRPLHVRPKR